MYKYRLATEWGSTKQDFKDIKSWYDHHKALGKKVAIYEKNAPGGHGHIKKKRALFVEGQSISSPGANYDPEFVQPDYRLIEGESFPIRVRRAA